MGSNRAVLSTASMSTQALSLWFVFYLLNQTIINHDSRKTEALSLRYPMSHGIAKIVEERR